MSKHAKQIFSALLASLLLCSALVGCGGDGTSSGSAVSKSGTSSTTGSESLSEPGDTGEPGEVNWVIYGDKNDRMTSFLEQVQQYVQDQGLNVEVSLQVLPWSEYAGGQTTLKLASGEEFACYTDTPYLGNCISNGYIQDVTDVVEEYGQTLKEKLDETSFTAFSKGGRLYAVPVGEKNNASEWYGGFEVRQDLLEEAGVSEITSLEDLEAFYDACIQLHPDYTGFCESGNTAKFFSRSVTDKTILFLDNNCFLFVDNSADDDVIYSYYESEEFKKTCEIAQRWREKGIISNLALSDPSSLGNNFLAGQGMFRGGNGGRIYEDTEILTQNVPEAEVKVYMTGNGQPKVTRGNYSTAFQIFANVTNPEDYVQFLDLIYRDQESFDFFTYGDEGTDYTLDENGRISGQTVTGVFFEGWTTAHIDYMRFSPLIPDEQVEAYKQWNDGAEPQKDLGFVFDTEPVEDVIAQLSSVYTEYCEPMLLGFTTYEDGYDELISRLKSAGLDDYMAEYQAQFSEFYNNQ
jgi:putative aldouronate transport system substrate-binding protein